jgi:hypothetical protein
MYSTAANELAFSANGVLGARIDSSGNFRVPTFAGFGGSNPSTGYFVRTGSTNAQTLMSGVTQGSLLCQVSGNASATTTVEAAKIQANTQATSFTCGVLRAAHLSTGVGAGSTVTRNMALSMVYPTLGTNNAAITDSPTTFTGNYFIYSAATSNPSLISGDLQINTAGKGVSIKEGSNAKMGIATLSAGTVVVSTTAVTATSRIFLTAQTLGTITVPVGLAVSARTAATSFTILSGNLTDTSTVAWMIVEPL